MLAFSSPSPKPLPKVICVGFAEYEENERGISRRPFKVAWEKDRHRVDVPRNTRCPTPARTTPPFSFVKKVSRVSAERRVR